MPVLFIIATDRARLTWSDAERGELSKARTIVNGVFAIRLLRKGAQFQPETWRAFPLTAAKETGLGAGPPLFEETQYKVSLRAVGSHDVALEHRDPLVLKAFDDDERGRCDGLVN